MELKLGNKIRILRKKHRLTQEQFAEKMGVTFQAVSKWENDVALPDITIIPAMAHCFGISTDELLSYSSETIDNDITDIVCDAAQYRETNPQKGRQILEEGLKKYPDNDILLNNLLYVINYSENPDETIAIASKLVKKTFSDEVKYDAIRFLAYAYNSKGDTNGAVAALEEIPEIYFTKLSEMAFMLSGLPKYEAAEKQKWISFEILLQMMWKIAEFYRDNGESQKATDETIRALRLIDALDGEEKIGRFDNYAEFFKKQIELMK